MQPTKSELINIVTLLGYYCHRLLDGISLSDLTLTPSNMKGKSILNYFVQMVNDEIDWLRKMGYNSFNYLDEEASYQDSIDCYDQLNKHLIAKIEASTEADLEIHNPIFENDVIQVEGSLGWIIWRNARHAIFHFAQIVYLRSTVNSPPEEGLENSWFVLMDELNSISHHVKHVQQEKESEILKKIENSRNE